MKVHDRILQDVAYPRQNLDQKGAPEDFKEILTRALQKTSSPSEAAPVEGLSETLSGVYELAEEVITLLGKVSAGDQKALNLLAPKAQELERLAQSLKGSAREFLEELSLTVAVSRAKAEEGFI